MKGAVKIVQVNYDLSASWVRIGPVAGVLGIAAYFAAAMGNLPSRVTLVLAFSMGPLLSVAFMGFYHFLRAHQNSAALQTATVFGVIGGTIVNLMLVVQQSLFISLPSATRAALGSAWTGLNMVQLGMDVSWDIYISVATILLGAVLWKHPRFGRVLGGITVFAGSLLLLLNLWTFPTPPGESGLIDIGPFVGLWFVVVSVRMLFSVKWWTTRYVRAETANS
ncbi:MAG: hypothetical protein LAP85_23860 [Acidobacteriia bacterium]|nr:hypothetical protein [Terriglobia bacterium]